MDLGKGLSKARGFEVAKGFEEAEIQLPIRSTKSSAGYDFSAAEDIVIDPIWKVFLNNIGKVRTYQKTEDENWKTSLTKLLKPTLVTTGIKAYMYPDEFLGLYNRSSNPMKKLLIMTNGTGVVDSDYYENPDNDGHIMFQFINVGFFPVHIKKGERIGQGIFHEYLAADEEYSRTEETERAGGFGSTDEGSGR